MVDFYLKISDYGWVDGEVVRILSKAMNFKINYVNTTGRSTFGELGPDGKYTGALNALENEEIDLAANVRTIQIRKLEKSMSLYPVYPKGFSVLVPKRPHKVEISYLDAVNISCGFALVVFMFLVFLTWIKLGFIYKKIRTHEEPIDAIRVVIIIFGTLLYTSQPPAKFGHEKSLMTAVLFSSVILSSTYQAKMVQHLTTSTKSADLKNVRELLQTNLTIIVPDALKNTISLESLSSDTSLTRGKSIVVSSNYKKVINAVVTKKDTAYILGDLFCEFTNARLYDDKGNRFTHVIKRVVTVPASLMTLKKSPYKYRFNQILLALCEIGVMNKIFGKVYDEIDALKHKSAILRTETKTFYTMEQLGFIFKAFIACLGACCLIFLCEVILSRYHRTLKPRITYDSHNEQNKL